jgi:hypothetical protein
MGKKEQKQIQQQNTADRAVANERYSAFTAQNKGQQDQMNKNYNTNYKSLSGGYQGLADTGGWTEQMKAGVRSRANSANDSTYAQANQNLQRRMAMNGGYMPGFAAGISKLARDQATTRATGAKETELGINQAVATGKLAGLGGLGQLQGINANMLTNATDAQLRAMGMTNDQINAIRSSQTNIATQPGAFGSVIKGIGEVGGAVAGVGSALFCWVAIELWGPCYKTVNFMHWLRDSYRKTIMGSIFCNLYSKYGERTANYIKTHIIARKFISFVFNSLSNKAIKEGEI